MTHAEITTRYQELRQARRVTYYHVASPTYEPGDDLLCWDLCQQAGVECGGWKWTEAPEGFDGQVVSLYEDIDDARDHQVEHGGTILTVTLDDDAMERGERYDTLAGYITPRMGRNAEGFATVRHGIPSALLAAFVDDPGQVSRLTT